MRLVWTTDPHLNHTDDSVWREWIQSIASHEADGVVITGDISEGDDVVVQLQRLREALPIPIYFVLGNHDFYDSSIGRIRQQVVHAAAEWEDLHYLTDCGSISLDPSDSIVLLGEDGWGDASEGDYEHSTIDLNDFRRIDDFRHEDPSLWKAHLLDLGAQSAERLEAKLRAVPSSVPQVVVATHVPPFCETCWYEGRTTDANWAPFFVCGQLGKLLLDHAAAHQHQHFTVLCGHTHHSGVARMRDNLIVYTGAAQYGCPSVEAIISGDSDGVQLQEP